MNTLLFLVTFFGFGALYVILGIQASKKVKTSTDYFVANRQLGFWQISCNLIATQLGGGLLLGTAACAYTHGFYGICYPIGIALGFFLLATGIASRLQAFKVTTVAQLFETQYGSPRLRKVAALFSITTLFGILIAQVVGFKSLMFAVGFGSWFIIWPFWLSVVGYTMIGGLRAITINDMVQLAIITFSFTLIVIFTIINKPTYLVWSTAQEIFATKPITAAYVSSSILMPALSSLFTQDLAQRFFASRTKLIATSSALVAGIFLIIFSLIPIYIGMKAKLLEITIPEFANPLISFLQYYMPDILFALALCAIVAAIISTADALMNGISANITQDFNLGKKISGSLVTSKFATLIIGISGLIASYLVPPNIIDIILGSNEISISCLLIPLLFCYFKKNVPKNGAIGAIILGLVGFFLFRLYPQSIPREILTLSLSLLGYAIGSRIK